MKKMIISVLALSLILGGCAKINPEKQAEKEILNEVIKIGAILPLTGQNAAIGEGIKNAIEIASKKYNNVKIIYEDDQFDGKIGISAYHKLVDIDNVNAIINTTPATVNAFQSLLENNPLMVIQIAEPEIVKDDTVFQIMPSGASVYVELGKIVAKKYNSIAFVYQNGPAFEKAKNTFQNTYKNLSSGKIKAYKIGESKDYRTIITEIIAEKFDSFTIVATPNVGIPFLKQFIEQSKGEMQLVCNGDLEVTISNYLKVFSPEIFEGCYSAMFTDRMSNEFKTEYKNTYGSEPGFATDYAYDAVGILMDTYLSNIQEWKNNLQSLSINGVSGDIEFDANGVRLPEVNIHVFKNGKFVIYEE